ncbi:MAG TPA: YciI family protein [Tepidisphaeraceae bacterium]|nr:YciI family protein [Tepidisphaeraceae bacterium]
MRYLCLGYHDEKQWQAMNARDRDALMVDLFAFEAMLKKNGHYVQGIGLQGTETATTLRFENGRSSITDGPFTETKEQLGGVMVLEANDLNHAIQLMSQMPCMRVGGSLEIRPINEELTSQRRT